MGAVAGPFDSWLVLRGLKTLAVRMERHCDNAERVVELLVGAPGGRRAVHYPGLPDHPGHDVAAKQMRRFGGMVSFRSRAARRALGVCGATRICHPRRVPRRCRVAHRAPGPDDPRSVAGTPLEVPADLVRLSVGIEDVDDLLADLDAALSAHG